VGKKSIARGSDLRKTIFTASELAELAGFDAALDAEEILLTRAERKLSRELDREARAEAETEEGGASAFDRRAGKDLSTACGAPPLSGEAKKTRKPETAEQRAARLEKNRLYRETHREQLRLSSARYNEAHRQERRDYQKAYDAAHKAEISARRRKKDADGKQKEKENG